MFREHIVALKAAVGTLLLIGVFATIGAGVMTIGIGMDTPWAPWEDESDVMFDPLLFTLASFAATVAFCATTVVYRGFLPIITNKPDTWWRISGIVFLVSYGIYSTGSGTTEAAIMLTILHLIVGIPALTLLPRTFGQRQFNASTES